ncbi:MAG: outer membrane protein assembly factor BamD, partial [Rhodobacter sp.]|nr:outer membrane protein assembly factor BamD [Rhodobacter sp.]
MAAVLATGCSRNREGPIEDQSAQQIFQRAEYQLEVNRADDAAELFGEVERLYPYSELAKRALIMQAFAYHKDQDYEQSRVAAQRYIDFYPADEDAAYAQYLLALSYYDQIDEVGRDLVGRVEVDIALRRDPALFVVLVLVV